MIPISDYFNLKSNMQNIIFDTIKISIEIPIKNRLSMIQRHKLKFFSLIDSTCVDYINYIKLVSIFINCNNKNAIYLIAPITNKTLVESTQHSFFSSIVTEREIFEMFGVFSINAIDLRRLLTNYSLISHPLRKDFPLAGYESFFWDVSGQVLTKRLCLTQKFRNFFYKLAWILAV